MKDLKVTINGEEIECKSDSTLVLPRRPVMYINISDAFKPSDECLYRFLSGKVFDVDVSGVKYDAEIKDDKVLIYDKIFGVSDYRFGRTPCDENGKELEDS